MGSIFASVAAHAHEYDVYKSMLKAVPVISDWLIMYPVLLVTLIINDVQVRTLNAQQSRPAGFLELLALDLCIRRSSYFLPSPDASARYIVQ